VYQGDVFAELGEALFWLGALADATKRREPLLNGLQWARNRVAHGHLVAAPVAYEPGAGLGHLVLGRSRLGTASKLRWSPESSVPSIPRKYRDARQDADYRGHVEGREVMPVLRDVLHLLTVP